MTDELKPTQADAYLYENDEGSRELIFNCNGERAQRLLEFGYRETPLYAHPASQPSPDVVELREAGWRVAKEIAASALQTACEIDPADPDHPDTVMLTTSDLETIVRCAVENWQETAAFASIAKHPSSAATAVATPSPNTGGESPAPDGLAAKLVRLCCEVELRFTGQFCEQLVNALSAAAAALSASNTPHLTHIIDRDRYIVAMSLGHIREGLNCHRWLLEGRGPYEWDDDRYRDEFRAWLESVERATGALAKLAFDKADCTTDPALVAKAQEAARAYVAEAPKGHREMLPSDLGLPCPSCAAAAKRPVTQGSTLEPDDLLPSYCRLIDALQGDDPDAVDTAFQASIEAVTKFGLLRASMNPTDMHSDGMNLP